MKIQVKIAILFTLLCALIMIILSLAVYYFANEKAFHDFYTRLELRATMSAKAKLAADTSHVAAYELIRSQHIQTLPEESEQIIRADSLELLMASGNKTLLPTWFLHDILHKKQASFRKGYTFYKGILFDGPKGSYAFILSAEHSFARNFLHHLKVILITANLASMVVIFIFGLIFSEQILKPIRKITQEVNNISATSLNSRLSVRPGKDEITELANTFNNMISRLETAFETQKNFVSNASHELNTPLTAIIGEAEFALARPRTQEQYRQGVQIILSQAGKLRDIIRSLLELAQSGYRGSLSFEPVKVSELLHNVQKVASSLYPDCHFVTDLSLLPVDINRLAVHGSFNLLELCLSNIFLNACKYSAGGSVVLALALSDKYVIFIIKDKGIGIPERDMPHIFDPFFRASNVKAATGYGIGLPLSQNIIRLHQGTIQVSSKESEGTEVVIRLPRELQTY